MNFIEAIPPLLICLLAFATLIIIAHQFAVRMYESISGRIVMAVCVLPAIYLSVLTFVNNQEDLVFAGFLAVATLLAGFDVCCLIAIVIANGLEAIGLID